MRSRYFRGRWFLIFLIIALVISIINVFLPVIAIALGTVYVYLPWYQPTIPSEGWSEVAPMPTARAQTVATVLDGKIYVLGGLVGAVSTMGIAAVNAFERYDPLSGEWQELTPIPVEEGLHHLAMAATGDRIYVAGGYRGGDENADFDSAWVYNPERDIWSQLADMPAPRGAHAMVAIEGRLYVVGGVGPRSEEVWVYNPASDIWDVVSILPTQREHLGAAAIDNKLYVIAGRWRGQSTFSTLEVYDPTTNIWMQLADMPTGRSDVMVSVMEGRLHVVGGEDLQARRVFREHEVYDPKTDTWERLPDLPTPRHGGASAVVDNRWHVIGGATGVRWRSNFTIQNMVEVFALESVS